MKKLTVISIGSATKDVFLVSKGFKIIKSKKFSTGYGECFVYGSKVDIAGVYFDTGGGATNSAATFASLGIPVGVEIQVGKDNAGIEVYADMKARGIDVSHVHTHPTLNTGYSTILLAESGDRTILVYRGASNDFDPKHITPNLKAEWFYLTAVGGNKKFIDKVFTIAKKNKTKIFWNPGGKELSYGISGLSKYLKQTEILSLNKEEGLQLTGTHTVKEILSVLHELVPLVIITDGKKGAYMAYQGLQYFIPSLGTPALNATGAGDAFGSGFLAGYIITGNITKAACTAIYNSDAIIRTMGAKNGIITKLPNEKMCKRVKIKVLSTKH